MYMKPNVGSKVAQIRLDNNIILWECNVCGTEGEARINNWNSPRARTCCGGPFYRNRDRLQIVWTDMRGRCLDVRHPAYSRYKDFGRPKWSCYRDFAEWAMNSGYEYGLDLDRIDNSLGYSPENCRFVTRKQNCRNRNNNRLISAFGESKTAEEWSEDNRCSVKGQSIIARIDRYGFTTELAITRPSKWF